MYPHNKYNPTNPAQPRPTGFSDRTNFYYYLDDLVWQDEWAGPNLRNTYLLVAPSEYDIPNEQARVIVIGPDPVPLKDPRPGYWGQQEAATVIPPQDIIEEFPQ